MVGCGNGGQRRHERVPFEGVVRVNGAEARGVDVSVGGLRLRSGEPAPPLGSTVIVEFWLPGAGPVALRAAVVRVEAGVVVSRFVRLDPRTMMTLVRFTTAANEAA